MLVSLRGPRTKKEYQYFVILIFSYWLPNYILMKVKGTLLLNVDCKQWITLYIILIANFMIRWWSHLQSRPQKHLHHVQDISNLITQWSSIYLQITEGWFMLPRKLIKAKSYRCLFTHKLTNKYVKSCRISSMHAMIWDNWKCTVK